VLDLIDVKSSWQQLGHDFRVFVRITIWKSDTALRVPLSALFRSGNAWSVFKVVDGEARLTKVEIGQRNTEHAEVLNGLETGDRVILHPSDRVVDGIAIEERDITGL
jgi:HlyD family secretion protein